MRTFIIKPGDLIPIGRAGENQATQIRFDVTGWADTFGAGTYTLVVKRPHEDTAYPVEVATDGDYVVWTVSNVDTGIAGNASVQLRYVVDGALAKSVIYTGIVGESLDNIVDPPDPFEDLIQRMVDLAERTEAAAESAAGSAASASESAGTATAAKTAAQSAKNAAEAAQSNAVNSATAAEGSATAAGNSATAAAASETAADASADAAEASATAADASADAAEASATAADASADAAAQSAAAAQAAAMDVIDKAPIITDTASGSIASFPDGADAPIKQLTVGIEPQQDLHGYDNPWPAGGGKNLFPLPTSAITKNGITVESANGELWIHGTPTISSGHINFQNVAIIPSSIDGQTVSTSINEKMVGIGIVFGSANGSINFTLSDTATQKSGVYTTGTHTVEVDVRYDVGTIDKKFKIQLEIGSTATAWTPYSNICPITGWTGANVTVSPTLDAQDGQTYPITWQTEAGTVYGGTLTVEQDGTGTLVVDCAYVELTKNSNWSWQSTNGLAFCSIPNAIIVNASNQNIVFVKNNLFTSTAWVGRSVPEYACGLYYGGSYVFVRSANHISNVDDLKAVLGDNVLQLVYTLATPITYTLSEELTTEITTLLGQNNWWASCGDISEIEYRADTKLYIDKKLAALLAALS